MISFNQVVQTDRTKYSQAKEPFGTSFVIQSTHCTAVDESARLQFMGNIEFMGSQSNEYFKTTILDTLYLNSTTFQENFHSPQVNQYLKSIVNILVYNLLHKLWKNLRFSILGNYEILEKYQNMMEIGLSSQSSFQKQNFRNNGKKLRKGSYQSFLLSSSKAVLIDRIEHEYLFYCSNLVFDCCFLILNLHKYHI